MLCLETHPSVGVWVDGGKNDGMSYALCVRVRSTRILDGLNQWLECP